MYADERYTKITQAEINEAKKRVAEREKYQIKHPHHEEMYDWIHTQTKQEKRLYP